MVHYTGVMAQTPTTPKAAGRESAPRKQRGQSAQTLCRTSSLTPRDVPHVDTHSQTAPAAQRVCLYQGNRSLSFTQATKHPSCGSNRDHTNLCVWPNTTDHDGHCSETNYLQSLQLPSGHHARCSEFRYWIKSDGNSH